MSSRRDGDEPVYTGAMKAPVDATDLDSLLTAANRHARVAIDEHHAAGRSTYFADEVGRVFEETPAGEIYEVRNTEAGVKRIRQVKPPE